MFWWNKFAELGYINLAKRRPKAVTYSRKNLGFGDGRTQQKTLVSVLASDSVPTLIGNTIKVDTDVANG